MKMTMNKTRLGCKYRGPVYYHEGATLEGSNYRVSQYGTWWCISKRDGDIYRGAKSFRTLRECKAWVKQQIETIAA
jgi:hypothetical protein